MGSPREILGEVTRLSKDKLKRWRGRRWELARRLIESIVLHFREQQAEDVTHDQQDAVLYTE